MAWFSFHGGHSGEFCCHAQGRLEDVLEAAVRAGFSSYGVSEHAPKQRDADLYEDEAGLTAADTQDRFGKLRAAMHRAQHSLQAVVTQLRDHVLFLKHNLNAQAIGQLKAETEDIETDINQLITDMRRSIKEADAFIQTLE